ncbi:hypothetical protein BD769DRAFT_1775483 [Suillus cothurnatus]|nr:hypothetical protein BD769DRAFT_1775483 [Suillus cothurnatus]
MSKSYVCSTGPGCNQTFTKFTDLKKHEAAHSKNAYLCTWPDCDFATMIKDSYEIHAAKHAGEQRHICPQDDCDYKTHNPASLTYHRKTRHGHVPLPRGHGARSAKGTFVAQSSSQPVAQLPLPPLPPPPGTMNQYQLQHMQSQPMQLQPTPPRHMQFHPTQYQAQPTQYQAPPPINNQSLGVFYGPSDAADDYAMYTGPARAPNGWTDGCMCPELMQRRPSEMLGYEYRRH